jgi:hypothetical protein
MCDDMEQVLLEGQALHRQADDARRDADALGHPRSLRQGEAGQRRMHAYMPPPGHGDDHDGAVCNVRRSTWRTRESSTRPGSSRARSTRCCCASCSATVCRCVPCRVGRCRAKAQPGGTAAPLTCRSAPWCADVPSRDSVHQALLSRAAVLHGHAEHLPRLPRQRDERRDRARPGR